MRFSFKPALTVFMILGLSIWMIITGAGPLLAAPGGGGRPSRAEIEAKAKEHGESSYQMAIDQGSTKEEAARSAGFAAGRRAARLGATPYDASSIAEREVKKRGGTVKDAADAASYAAAEAGGDGYSIGYAIRAVVWDTIASLVYELRELVARYQIVRGKEQEKIKKEIDAKSAELGGWIDYTITKAGKDARAAGASPEEEGRAIGAAVIAMPLTFIETVTNKSLGDRIRDYAGDEGKGLNPVQQGVLTGKAYQTAGGQSRYWAGSESDKSVKAAGGTVIDEGAARIKLFGAPVVPKRAQNGVGPDSQSGRLDTPGEDANRLAAIGQIMGGLNDTSGTSVQTPFGGNGGGDLLAKAREGSKNYRVIPRERRRERNPGSGEATGGEGAGSPTATETSTSSSPPSSEGSQVATSTTSTASTTSGTSGFVGHWKGDGGCSLASISITANYTLKGAGPDIPLSVKGNEATGTGAVLFGKGGHYLRLRVTYAPDQIEMDGSNDEGGSCVSMFSRIEF